MRRAVRQQCLSAFGRRDFALKGQTALNDAKCAAGAKMPQKVLGRVRVIQPVTTAVLDGERCDRHAIERYYLAGRSLPLTIDDLIDDKRFPVPLHHLRRAYPDPITGSNDWELLRDGTGIYGIHSKSDAAPIKHANFPGRYAFFANAQTYADWQFVYPVPGMGRRSAAGTPALPPRLTIKPGRPAR